MVTARSRKLGARFAGLGSGFIFSRVGAFTKPVATQTDRYRHPNNMLKRLRKECFRSPLPQSL